MEKLFENVMLAEFASNLETCISFKAKGGMRQRERLLETFFNNLIAPLLDGAEAVMEVMAMESKKKVWLAESVIKRGIAIFKVVQRVLVKKLVNV